jgi:hypothetical protein
MSFKEQEELRGEFLQIAVNHQHLPGLVDFTIKLTAHLWVTDLERQDQRAELERYIDERRRERPYGSPGNDVSGIAPWSQVSGPPDDES